MRLAFRGCRRLSLEGTSQAVLLRFRLRDTASAPSSLEQNEFTVYPDAGPKTLPMFRAIQSPRAPGRFYAD